MILFLSFLKNPNKYQERLHKLYAGESAAMNTLNQVAGAAGTAIAITLYTTEA